MNYKCLDAYLGDNFFTRFYRYYELEWGKGVAPTDPHAPAGSRSDAAWPPTPESSPPMPFAEWPYGGTQNIGKTLPNSVDLPLMVALGNTQLGKAMSDAHVQVYGWIDGGGNLSTNNVKPGGNAPAAYDYTPNTVQLDQAVVYIERLPDEVQNDHFDWGFRIANLYGENYRYTIAYGLFSNQLLNKNQSTALTCRWCTRTSISRCMQGFNLRVGRFISIPDIEAQLAPNNYTYVHSLTYSLGQLHQYRRSGYAGRHQELDRPDGLDRRQRHHAVERGCAHFQPLRSRGKCRSALSRHVNAQGSRRRTVGYAGRTLDQ